MPLIASISGTRGTIGGRQGEGLTPADIVMYVAAYAGLVREGSVPGEKRPLVLVGRDARMSGEMVNRLVTGTLMGMGCDVGDLGLATTPTVEMAVLSHRAAGGIILTASHNPAEWNALKFLGGTGEFISADAGKRLLEIAASGKLNFAPYDALGSCRAIEGALEEHIRLILDHPLVDREAIRKAGLKVCLDPVNSVGGIAVPVLLKALGVKETFLLNGEADGRFAHDPEPLPGHLEDLSGEVVRTQSAVGFAVDPDVDRLAIVCENGTVFGEEYTLVAVADYVLQSRPGPVVNNLSSTRALRDVAGRYGQECYSAAVGEVNVVALMKKTAAVIGGEGNGGVILPDLHFGRDALAGIALFLSHLARAGKPCSRLREQYPSYHISKNKITLSPGIDVGRILAALKEHYRTMRQDDTDGLWIDFGREWVHLRKSNTEPVIRIYAESDDPAKADRLAAGIRNDIGTISGKLA